MLNIHVPPYATGLDEAPVLDENLRVVQVAGQVKFAPVGSRAVRTVLEEANRWSGSTATSTSHPGSGVWAGRSRSTPAATTRPGR